MGAGTALVVMTAGDKTRGQRDVTIRLGSVVEWLVGESNDRGRKDDSETTATNSHRRC